MSIARLGALAALAALAEPPPFTIRARGDWGDVLLSPADIGHAPMQFRRSKKHADPKKKAARKAQKKARAISRRAKP